MKKLYVAMLVFVSASLSVAPVAGSKYEEPDLDARASSYIYSVSPTGWHSVNNIVECQMAGEASQIKVECRKVDQGPYSQNGLLKIQADNMDNYTFDISPTGYVCESGGIVELRLVEASNSDIEVRMRKCAGGSFSQSGRLDLLINGVVKYQRNYNAGITQLTFDIDPVNDFDLHGSNTFQGYVYSADQPTLPKKTGTITVKVNFDSYDFGPCSYSQGAYNVVCYFDPVSSGLIGQHTYRADHWPAGQDYPIRGPEIKAWEVAVQDQPDLTVSSLSLETNGPYYPGSTVLSRVQVYNSGTASAGSSTSKFYVASAANGDPLSFYETNPIGSLAPSASIFSDEDVAIPLGISGNYYLVSQADFEGVVSESDESNNRKSVAITISQCSQGTLYCDVPDGHPFQPFVEAMYPEISSGCRSGTVAYQNLPFCPESRLSRWMGFVWALRAEHGGDYVPPAATTQIFDDVPLTHPWVDWINQAYNEGLTNGCNVGPGFNFCPDYDTSGDAGIMDRGDWLVVMSRAFNWDLDFNVVGVFNDVDVTDSRAPVYEYAYWRGIAGGETECLGTGLRFCADWLLDRQHAAAMLTRAAGLVTVYPRCATLTTSSTAEGIVGINPMPDCPVDNTQYRFGTDITITPVADPGYLFSYWSGDVSGVQNPLVLQVGNGSYGVSKSVVANFAKRSSLFSISGRALLNSTGLGRVSITLNTGASTQTDTNGNYVFTGLVQGTYAVIPSLLGYTFQPTHHRVTVGPSDATNINFTAAAVTQDVILDVAYVDQVFAQENQECFSTGCFWNDCGPASVAMVVHYLGFETRDVFNNPDPTQELECEVKGSDCDGMTDVGSMKDVINNRGGDSYIDWSPTYNEIVSSIDNGYPVIVGVATGGDGHVAVVVGYGPNDTIILNDPYGGFRWWVHNPRININTPYAGFPQTNGQGIRYNYDSEIAITYGIFVRSVNPIPAIATLLTDEGGSLVDAQSGIQISFHPQVSAQAAGTVGTVVTLTQQHNPEYPGLGGLPVTNFKLDFADTQQAGVFTITVRANPWLIENWHLLQGMTEGTLPDPTIREYALYSWSGNAWVKEAAARVGEDLVLMTSRFTNYSLVIDSHSHQIFWVCFISVETFQTANGNAW